MVVCVQFKSQIDLVYMLQVSTTHAKGSRSGCQIVRFVVAILLILQLVPMCLQKRRLWQ
jgi:hypothetical protein